MQALLEEFRKLPDYRKNKVGYTQPGEILFLSLLAVRLTTFEYFTVLAI